MNSLRVVLVSRSITTIILVVGRAEMLGGAPSLGLVKVESLTFHLQTIEPTVRGWRLKCLQSLSKFYP